MQDSSCFVGIVTISDDNGDGVEDLPDSAADIVLGPTQPEIKKLRIKGIKGLAGDYFVNSNIAAARIETVYLYRTQYDYGGGPFGLAAGSYKKVTIKEYGLTQILRNPISLWRKQNFEIRVV